MKDMRKFRSNLILLAFITAVYMLGAYYTRNYYAVGLEIFTPCWIYVCWLYADEDTDKYA